MIKVFVPFRFSEKQKDELEAQFPECRFVCEPDHDAQIIIGNYSPAKLKQFTRLKLIQTAAVGVDAYIHQGVLNDDTILCNAVNIHTREVAEHTLAMILALCKKLPLYRDDQHQHIWRDEGQVKEISSLRVTIVGLGDIGSYLARQLKALGVYVRGVKRNPAARPDYVDELYLSDELLEAVSHVDVVVAVLPGNRANENLFTIDTFKAMDPDTIFINVGRGNLYPEGTLETVLKEKIIAAASADVYLREPLQSDSELWDMANMFVTPHIAGSYHLDSAREDYFKLVKENLRRYLHSEELLHVVTERD